MKDVKNQPKNTYFLTQASIIAALYLALTLPFQPISFSAIQFRISEILCVLPFFTGAAVPGLTVGCLLANFLCGAPMPDVIFGTLATCIGAAGTYFIGDAARNGRFREPLAKRLSVLPPILSNVLIIPPVLKFAYGTPELLPFLMFTVGMGEVLAVGVLGSMLLRMLEKYKRFIFKYC